MNRNQMMVAQNAYQGDTKKILCVCSAGVLRSPTIARELAARGYNTRAVGSEATFALIPLTDVLCLWADMLICVSEVEADVRATVDKLYPEYQPEVAVLDIPDQFGFGNPVLVTRVKDELDNLGLY